MVAIGSSCLQGGQAQSIASSKPAAPRTRYQEGGAARSWGDWAAASSISAQKVLFRDARMPRRDVSQLVRVSRTGRGKKGGEGRGKGGGPGSVAGPEMTGSARPWIVFLDRVAAAVVSVAAVVVFEICRCMIGRVD